jgi:hypothetical protein
VFIVNYCIDVCFKEVLVSAPEYAEIIGPKNVGVV